MATKLANSAPTTGAHSSHPSQSSGSLGHKRVYQACTPCRRRKVRCDLGPVDAPNEPPCVRCRRESKECFFSDTRRKRKVDGAGSGLDEDEHITDEYAARNSRRKSARERGSLGDYEPGLQNSRRSMTSGSQSGTSPLDGYTLPGEGAFQQPSPYSTDNIVRKSEDGQDQEVANETAAILFQAPINIPTDSIHLLLKASNESEDLQRRDAESQKSHSTSHPIHGSMSAQVNCNSTQRQNSQGPAGQKYPTDIDTANQSESAGHRKDLFSPEAIRLWSRLRFVKAGWFTAAEAISYIDYFYAYLNPLTPISLPACRPDTAHLVLLNDEPMLTVTILTIASRYKKLPGLGGQTRSFMIHERLWTYLQDMITRMFWGQEQFGGGFCGAGKGKLAQTGGKRGLRSLGTIESLLLLNEFHPRSMHFPPRDDDDDILAPAEDEVTNSAAGDEMPAYSGNPMFRGWSEPAVRSDRMCWSLIGMSYVLAYELGIFGNYTDGFTSVEQNVKRTSGSSTQRLRADRVERALYIFVTQASGRFGLPSMWSDQINRFRPAHLEAGLLSVDPAMLPESVDKSQQCWIDLMTIMKETNDALFASEEQTAQLVQTGDYMGQLDRLQPLLRGWHQRFERLEVEKHPRLIISIEYHYISLYINSLALQAVIQQWTTKVNSTPQVESPASPASSVSSLFARIYNKNERYIKEVIDSSRTVLRHVVEGFLPDDYLKHAPVRTYFRIIAAATFLLKTFALGGKQGEVAISLRLLSDTAKALRTSYVDDVHLCLRVADDLDGLISRLRSKFVRLPPRPQEQQAQYKTGNIFNPPTRFQYRPSPGDTIQNPLAGITSTYNSPHDTEIRIMPPLGNTYAPNANHMNYTFQTPESYSPNQQHQQAYNMNSVNNDGTTNFSLPPEEDWLTLDLNPLLDTSGFGVGDSQWYGALGPETHNNLEVLGKLVNEQYRGDEQYRDSGYGDGSGLNF